MVPAVMIPVDLLDYFGSYKDSISNIRILHHFLEEDKYFALIEFISSSSCDSFVSDFQNQLLSSLEDVHCDLKRVKSINIHPLEFSNKSPIRKSPLAPLDLSDERDTMPVSHLISISRQFYGSLVNPVSSSSYLKSDLITTETAAEDDCALEDICVVCLESLAGEGGDVGGLYTSFCGHSFHVTCVLNLEGPQCPICRFQHDSTRVSTSTCTVCSRLQRRAEQSEGRASSSASSASSASSSSRGGGGSVVVRGSAGVDSDSSRCLEDASAYAAEESEDGETEVWMCLLCGFLGCGQRRLGHSRQHYEETLHTYAMNTSTRHVWDFAGSGFVHRLILTEATSTAIAAPAAAAAPTSTHHSSSSSPSSSPPSGHAAVTSSRFPSSPSECPSSRPSASASHHRSSSPSSSNVNVSSGSSSGSSNAGRWSSGVSAGSKVVEIINPSTRLDTRPQAAALTDAQEEMLVNRKLESSAHQYNQLLVRQLEQQRLQYEHKLKRLQKYVCEEAVNLMGDSAVCGHASDGGDAFTRNSANNSSSSSSSSSISSSIGGEGVGGASRGEGRGGPSINGGSGDGDVISVGIRSWSNAIFHHLDLEKTKVIRQNCAAQSRLSGAQKQLEELLALGHSLEENKDVYRVHLESATKRVLDVEVASRRRIKDLEMVVADLMAVLDDGAANM